MCWTESCNCCVWWVQCFHAQRTFHQGASAPGVIRFAVVCLASAFPYKVVLPHHLISLLFLCIRKHSAVHLCLRCHHLSAVMSFFTCCHGVFRISALKAALFIITMTGGELFNLHSHEGFRSEAATKASEKAGGVVYGCGGCNNAQTWL